MTLPAGLPEGQDLRSFATADGRTIHCIVDLTADADAPLLVFHHGTPAAGPMSPALLAAAHAAGFRLVELVRPGYGPTERAPGRTVASNTLLTRALVAHLGGGPFASCGWSGGGPHTLADAALIDDCVGSVCIAGVGPFDAPDLDFLAGMGQDNLDEFGAASDPAALETYLTATAAGLRGGDADTMRREMASLLPPADLAFLDDATAANLAESIAWSVSHGIWGWFDDDIAFTNPWGFDPSAIRVPVTLLQGADDLMVPFAHGQWLAARMPHARAILEQGEGHLSIVGRYLTDAMLGLRAHLQ